MQFHCKCKMQMAMVVVVEWGEGGVRSGLAVLLIHSEVPALIPKASASERRLKSTHNAYPNSCWHGCRLPATETSNTGIRCSSSFFHARRKAAQSTQVPASMQGFRFHSLSKGCPIPLLPRVMVLPSDVLPVVMQGSSSKAGEQIR